jgi:hypothetical protein
MLIRLEASEQAAHIRHQRSIAEEVKFFVMYKLNAMRAYI